MPRISQLVAFLTLLGLSPFAASQPAQGQHRIAFVNVGPAAQNAANVAEFRAGLADLGYVEGRNLTIEFRWGDNKPERLPGLVNELLTLNPLVILSAGGPATIRAVSAATRTVPVVFITGDPVTEKLVPNMARPGGNLTGMAVLAGELEAKRLEVLTQIAPRARRIGVVWNPAQPAQEHYFRNVEAAAQRLGLTLVAREARNREQLEDAFTEITRAKVDGIFVVSDPVLGFERARIVEFVNAQRLPSVFFWREFAEAGGLASYGTSLTAVYRNSATQVAKILKGAKPGDLPIEQPTTFELVVNLKTARALGIEIPRAVLLRADKVIE